MVEKFMAALLLVPGLLVGQESAEDLVLPKKKSRVFATVHHYLDASDVPAIQDQYSSRVVGAQIAGYLGLSSSLDVGGRMAWTRQMTYIRFDSTTIDLTRLNDLELEARIRLWKPASKPGIIVGGRWDVLNAEFQESGSPRLIPSPSVTAFLQSYLFSDPVSVVAISSFSQRLNRRESFRNILSFNINAQLLVNYHFSFTAGFGHGEQLIAARQYVIGNDWVVIGMNHAFSQSFVISVFDNISTSRQVAHAIGLTLIWAP